MIPRWRSSSPSRRISPSEHVCDPVPSPEASVGRRVNKWLRATAALPSVTLVEGPACAILPADDGGRPTGREAQCWCEPPFRSTMRRRRTIGQSNGQIARYLVMSGEILPNHCGLVAQCKDELGVSVMRVQVHHVPQARTPPDLDHRLRPMDCFLLQPRTQPTSQDHDLHGTCSVMRIDPLRLSQRVRTILVPLEAFRKTAQTSVGREHSSHAAVDRVDR